jgi:Domain of unknown function (DUF4845)
MRDRLPSRERGITAIGLIILITFVGVFAYAGIRLLPVYLEYFSVVRAIQSLKADAESGPTAMRKELEKRFDIDNITSLDWHEVQITKEGSSYAVHAAYDAETPFIANVGFIVHFDKTVNLGGSSAP